MKRTHSLCRLTFSALLLLAAGCAGDDTTGSTGGPAGGTDVTATGDASTDVADTTPGAGADTTDDDLTQGDGTTTDDASDESDAAEDAIVESDTAGPVACTFGLACDDGDACTKEDECGEDGFCHGTAYVCNDDRTCTDDLCLGDGDCEFVVNPGTCLIANLCYDKGGHHELNECVVCDPDVSETEWAIAADETPCADANQCLTKATCKGGQCQTGLKFCDDGNACSDDFCDPKLGCTSTPNADPCDDGNACSQGDTCEYGECAQGLIVLDCDDGKPCTQDLCAPSGCVHTPTAGKCEDGTACTVNDTCDAGECISGPLAQCDDGNSCTNDTCDPYLGCVPEFIESACCIGGISLCDDHDPCTTDLCDEDQGTCGHTPNTAACDDKDACTGPDLCAELTCSGPSLDCDDFNACTTDSCDAGLGGCQHTPVNATCSDGNACTKDDKCVGGTCAGSPQSCSDGKPCTQDSCDPLKGCTYTPLTGACNDGDACTDATVCTPQGCVGQPTNCGDGNPCTNDSCNPLSGCAHQAIAGSCDDGLTCSTGDTCKNGACSADKTKCGCQPTFSDVVSHMTSLLIGTGGIIGQGLDIDKKKDTCSPSGCADGIDNQLSIFAPLANPELTKTFTGGGIALLLEHVALKTNGTAFTINFYPAEDDGSGCDSLTQSCGFYVQKAGVDAVTCKPLIQFKNAKIVGDKLTAGGPGSTFPFNIPVQGLNLNLVLGNATIEATVVMNGTKVTSMTGILGGAVAKETFLTAIDAIDPSGFPPGVTKDQLKGLISALVQNDIDTNGDGTKDAASIGLVFTTNAAYIQGLSL